MPAIISRVNNPNMHHSNILDAFQYFECFAAFAVAQLAEQKVS
jgi:hypothetical protein